MKTRIRIIVKALPFWSPCIYASNVSQSDYNSIGAAVAILAGFGIPISLG